MEGKDQGQLKQQQPKKWSGKTEENILILFKPNQGYVKV